MITSLNVNQFIKKGNWNDYKGKYKEKKMIWDSIKDYYFSYIRLHLIDKRDVVILHEVPYIKEIRYSNKGKDDYKRGKEITDIYQEFKRFCTDNNFDILEPSTSDTSFFRTIAIYRRGSYKRATVDINTIFTKYATRIVALEPSDERDEIIVGIHIPTNCMEYWINLIKLRNKFPKNNKILFIGDTNTYMPGTINKNMMYQFMNNDVIDAWLEKGYSHTRETFDGHTRIDYVFMTGQMFDDKVYDVVVDDDIRQKGFSDHSAIIYFEL